MRLPEGRKSFKICLHTIHVPDRQMDGQTDTLPSRR